MRRLISLVSICALLFGLTACGSVEKQTAVDNQMEHTVNQTESIVAVENSKETESVESISFDEIIVVNNELCTIKVTGIDADNIWGYTLKVYLENKSTDKTFMFSTISAAVNGVECDPLFATEVAAGKKSNEEIVFMSDALNIAGINKYTDIELSFRVYDTNNWEADDVAQASIHVYPYGKENAVKYTRVAQAEDIVLVDNEYAMVIVTGYEWDDIWGYAANLYIENKTDSSIMVSTEEVSVNGFMLDPFYADSVSAGNCAFSSMQWFEENLTENGITEIENIEFILRIYNENDWMADDYFNEVVALNP